MSAEELAEAARTLRKEVKALYTAKGLFSWPPGWEHRGLLDNRLIVQESVGFSTSAIEAFCKMWYRDPVGRALVEAHAEGLAREHAAEFNSRVRETFDRAASGAIREAEVPEHAG